MPARSTPHCQAKPVSIHAPRCREAMLSRLREETVKYYVSIHAPRCREAMLAPDAAPSRSTLGFNPRPSLPRGDAPTAQLKAWVLHKFQSTPLVAERRCEVRNERATKQAGFNPRPSLPRGDAYTEKAVRRKIEVSIHAPRCREAMQGNNHDFPPLAKFQSTPLVAERRCHYAASLSPSCSMCFNPRPSLPRGDARCGGSNATSLNVSIHAPRCREAMPPGPSVRTRGSLVSIHAPRCREAMHGSAGRH
ncbi:MAG: hypothetical protein RLZZ298_473 [Pseudomonadota bacterium]